MMSLNLPQRLLGGLVSRTPIILQTEAAECGLACLAMIAGHHGHILDMPAVRRRFSTSLKGMTLRDLLAVGNKLELATRALRLELADLRQLRLPCILHWDHNHFVVLIKAGANSITIHDPAVGRRNLPLAEVSRRFTGVALEAWPTERFTAKNERVSIRIFELVKNTIGIRRAATQIFAISLLLEAATIAMPIGFQLVIDEVVVAADYDLLTLIALGFALILILQAFGSFVRSWSTMLIGSSLALQWKASLFDHLMRLPFPFFEKRHVGDVVSRFGSLDSVQRTLTTSAIVAILDGLMSIGLMVMMWFYGGWLLAISAVATALYVLLRLLAYSTYRGLSEEAIVYSAQESSHFMESVRGIASLKVLNLEERRRSVWINHLVDRINAELRVQKFDIVFQTASRLLFGADRIFIVYFGARAVLGGDMSVGMLLAFLAYKDQLTARIDNFINSTLQLRMLSLHGERIADIALAAPEERPPNIVPLQKESQLEKAGRLNVENVSFRYSDNEPEVLSHLNIRIEAGECVGIAGPSGSGKTTFLKILAGLIVPTEGRVSIDGTPLSTIGPAAYRNRIGCVLQDDRMFAGSIAENICGFDPAPDAARLQASAVFAAVHAEILAMPMGYETLVGDMGNTLSGGQQQRIILARALYRQPSVLLLDEATSHLDPANEAVINAAIGQLPITRIVIAHRPSTLAMTDRIIEFGAS
ncbi:peptidase domain-containing ABC transporter [Phyllobacterium sp. K27]